MGRGNCCTTGPYEGLYYIDNDSYYVYNRERQFDEEPEDRLMGELDYDELTGGGWYFDQYGTECELDDIEECFMDDFTRMFRSFDRVSPNRWLDRSRRIILESKLFYVCIEDNDWSLAVELIQKEEPYGASWMENLQGQLYEKYLRGIKLCLLNRLPSIGYRKGAWTSGTIKREDVPEFADGRMPPLR